MKASFKCILTIAVLSGFSMLSNIISSYFLSDNELFGAGGAQIETSSISGANTVQGIYTVEEVKQARTIIFSHGSSDSERKQADSENLCATKNHVFVKDKILAENITHNPNRPIPRVVHFFVKSRCLPQDVAANIMQWIALEDHSILLHDHNEIIEYLSRERSDLAFVPKALKCAFQHETILDLARLVWLYDYGGISVDIDHVPGAGFLNGSLLDTINGSSHHFVLEDSKSHPYPRFIATEPRHYANYGSLIISVAGQYRQHTMNSTTWFSYTALRNDVYKHTLEEFSSAQDDNPISTSRHGKDSASVGIVNAGKTAGMMLIQMNITKKSMESVTFTNKNIAQCVDLTNASFKIDSKALLDLTEGAVDENTSKACPDKQVYMSNQFNPQSINIVGRKIPKIVHMTSKNKCFTKTFADNANLWKFQDHSFFIHDDTTVKKLFNSREWPEFPLLQEVLPCISSGAMIADYWRYLAIWEYGGIYTDMDNAPGSSFNNGTVIADEYDAFFEVERDGFPSQYFFAASPHHPVSYFMVAITIERLIYMVKSIRKTNYTPQTTGPGATKMAVSAHVGVMNPKAGNYTGVSNRTLTMVGNHRAAKRGVYCRRSVTGNKDIGEMNMTHYLGGGNVAKPAHSCKYEMMESVKAAS